MKSITYVMTTMVAMVSAMPLCAQSQGFGAVRAAGVSHAAIAVAPVLRMPTVIVPPPPVEARPSPVVVPQVCRPDVRSDGTVYQRCNY